MVEAAFSYKQLKAIKLNYILSMNLRTEDHR